MTFKTYIEIPIEVTYDLDQDSVVLKGAFIRDEMYMHLEKDILSYLHKEHCDTLVLEAKADLKKRVENWEPS